MSHKHICYNKIMILGFHAGTRHSVFLKDKLRIYKELGSEAIELGMVDANDEERWKTIISIEPEDLKTFKHISVHAPAGDFLYRDSEETHKILKKLEELYKKINFTHAVIHPDRVEDWSIFKQYSFPIAVENMDDRKTSFRDVESMSKFFEKVDLPMVLDLNHCYTNDRTMELAWKFFSDFSDRIKEVHLSGYTEDEIHESLHKTLQVNIMEPLVGKDIPVILEGAIKDDGDLIREYEYVKDFL